MEQKYNEIRRPIYNKRSNIVLDIPDFWLTAVSFVSLLMCFLSLTNKLMLVLQFLSHPALGDLLSDEDQKVCRSPYILDFSLINTLSLSLFRFSSI